MNDELLKQIMKERERQILLWGEQNHVDEWYFPILVEEIGEVAKAMIETKFKYHGANPGDTRKELIETVAVGLAWIECIDRRNQ